MKTLSITLLCLAFSCISLQSEAQIFKKLGDKIERSVEKRIDKKMNKAVDKTLDKAEEGTEQAVNDAVKPKSASEKAASENSVRASTSFPADFQLELTGSGPDMYMEYQVNMEGEGLEEGQVNMSMRMYTSPSQGAGRAETIMTMPMVGEIRMITLTDFDKPLQVTILNERKKEYSVIDFSEVDKYDTKEEYTVTRLGEEELHGMHCVRSRAVDQDGAAMEIWTTTEIPGYEDIEALYSKMQNMGSDDLWNELQEAGSAGFMVKLEVQTEGATSVMELVKIENVKVPGSMLVVPADYEEKEGGWAKRYLKGM